MPLAPQPGYWAAFPVVETELMTPGAPAKGHVGAGAPRPWGNRAPQQSDGPGSSPQDSPRRGTKQNKSREQPKADSGQSDSERPRRGHEVSEGAGDALGG